MFYQQSQSLWSQGGAASIFGQVGSHLAKCLNPFEVREVLQEWMPTKNWPQLRLNPFEVREVLQASKRDESDRIKSQSLWSQGGAARWCGLHWSQLSRLNPFEVREVLQEQAQHKKPVNKSQSLWSQGGAARNTSSMYCFATTSQSLWSQGGAASIYLNQVNNYGLVSIPLKSGRCCKVTFCTCLVCKLVSIPLKSGRCCKGALQNLLIKINKLFVSFR